MKLQVFGQVPLLREGLLTPLTAEGLYSCMDLEVVKDVPGLTELLPTVIVETSDHFVHPLGLRVIILLDIHRMFTKFFKDGYSLSLSLIHI